MMQQWANVFEFGVDELVEVECSITSPHATPLGDFPSWHKLGHEQ
jgi:hypothetical protein